MRLLRHFARAAALAWLLAPSVPVWAEPAPLVAAASDLKFALEETAAKFRAETGRDVTLVFGSSGNFTRQIEQGAPFRLFLSADEGYVRRLAEKSLTVDDGTLYAMGRIVLFAPHGSPLKPEAGLEGLRAALRANRVARFAIANPEHAPYGRAAMQALGHAGLADEIRPRLVLGENVSQAAQFAVSAAQGGIFAYSLALAPEVSKQGSFALIPAEWHEPLRQRMVLLKGADATARDFYAFLQARPAREIFIRYGFALPGEGS
jgi:molybdate transport system substrate-binding protein